jgi:hypothetical protein
MSPKEEKERLKQQQQQQQQQQQSHTDLTSTRKAMDISSYPIIDTHDPNTHTHTHTHAQNDDELEAEAGRPQSLKRVRSTHEFGLAGLILTAPPPPDCPPYLDGTQLPLWVGRTPIELTPEKVDELHHAQWVAWKEGEGHTPRGTGSTCGNSSSSNNNNGNPSQTKNKRRNYARILEVAPSIFNSAFVKLNPHNFAITVGITVDAMHHTNAPHLVCANTFMYGLSLLADNPVGVCIYI